MQQQLSPIGPALQPDESDRALTPSWDGIPAVDIKSDGVLGFISGILQRHAAFVVVFVISVAHVSVGWMAYRLFHLLAPDVQAAFLSTSDVRWTILVGVIWLIALVILTSVFVLRLVRGHITAPIASLADVSEAVARGDLAVPFVPYTSNSEVGRLSRATSSIIVALRRMATTMRTSARETTTLSAQITAASGYGSSRTADRRDLGRIEPGIEGDGSNDTRDRGRCGEACRHLRLTSRQGAGRAQA